MPTHNLHTRPPAKGTLVQQVKAAGESRGKPQPRLAGTWCGKGIFLLGLGVHQGGHGPLLTASNHGPQADGGFFVNHVPAL